MGDTPAAAVRRRGRPPASDAAVTRERILRAARTAFAASGYEAVTFQAIAAEVGLTRPAINNYFPSKSALFAEVLDRVSQTVAEAVRLAARRPGLPGQLAEFLSWTVRAEDADPAPAAILVQAALQPAVAGSAGREAAARIERFVRDAVGSARQRGELGPDVVAEAMCDVLMGLVWGTAFQASRDPGRDGRRAERMVDEVELLLRRAVSAA